MVKNDKVAIIKCPFTLRTNKSGAASINIGHTISILEQECNLDGNVFYFDYNNSEFYLFSKAVVEIINKEYAFFRELLPTERLSLIERIICEKYFEVDDLFEDKLLIDSNIGEKLLKILLLVYNEFINSMIIKQCNTFLIYVSPVISYQLILIDMIKKLIPNSKIIILDDYTFEPATPYYSAIITGKDRNNGKIGGLIDKDPLISSLKNRIVDIIDIIVEGEGYDFIRKFFKSNAFEHNLKGKVFGEDLNMIEQSDKINIGDCFEGKCYIINSNRINLDSLPFPNFEQMKNIYDFVEIEFTRGCKYRCLFCERSNMMESVISKHSVDYIVDEIKHIQRFGFKLFTIIDCCVNIDEDYTIDILKRFKKDKISIEYQCNLRGKEPNRELLDLLKETGCREVAFGIETIDEELLKSMNKEQNLEIINKLTNSINQYGMKLMLFLIIGFPTEKREAARRTLDFIIELNKINEIDIIELEFYRPGHIQMLSPRIYDKYGIMVENKISRELLKKSSYLYAEPGFLGLAYYKYGMSRDELASAIKDYVEFCRLNNISLATFY